MRRTGSQARPGLTYKVSSSQLWYKMRPCLQNKRKEEKKGERERGREGEKSGKGGRSQASLAGIARPCIQAGWGLEAKNVHATVWTVLALLRWLTVQSQYVMDSYDCKFVHYLLFLKCFGCIARMWRKNNTEKQISPHEANSEYLNAHLVTLVSPSNLLRLKSSGIVFSHFMHLRIKLGGKQVWFSVLTWQGFGEPLSSVRVKAGLSPDEMVILMQHIY